MKCFRSSLTLRVTIGNGKMYHDLERCGVYRDNVSMASAMARRLA